MSLQNNNKQKKNKHLDNNIYKYYLNTQLNIIKLSNNDWKLLKKKNMFKI